MPFLREMSRHASKIIAIMLKDSSQKNLVGTRTDQDHNSPFAVVRPGRQPAGSTCYSS